jgi:Caspase domain
MNIIRNELDRTALSAEPPAGWSLHIGLNRVNPDSYGGWPGRLRGCVNDVKDVQSIANLQQFTSVLLINDEAKREAVRTKIREIAAKCKSGDIFFLSYSGHGGYITDPTVPPVKPSGMSDTWCLYDGEIIDHELYNCWADFPEGVRILVLSDSCHSGTIVREALSARSTNRDSLKSSGVQHEVFCFQDEMARLLDLTTSKADMGVGGTEPFSYYRSIPLAVQRKYLEEHRELGSIMLESSKQRK